MTVFLWDILLVFFVLLLAYILLHFYYAVKALHPPKLEIIKNPKDYGMAYSSFTVTTTDLYKIKGWCVLSDRDNKGTIILVHNLGANRSKLLPYARFLQAQGYHVVLFDFRSHGESDNYHSLFRIIKGGEEDLLAVINYIKSSKWFKRTNCQIGLMGFSMGTISVVSLCGKIPAVKSAVLDCGPFISIKRIFTKTLSRTVKYHKFFIPQLFVLFIRLMLGKGGDYIKNAIGAVSPKALFFIQGEKDFIIPPEETKALYDESTKEPKEYWLVPKSYHLTAYSMYPEEYETKVLNFFSKTLV